MHQHPWRLVFIFAFYIKEFFKVAAKKFVELNVEVRAKAGKGAARATRREGLVPGVVYGGKSEPVMIAIDPRLIMRELHGSWRSQLYQIVVDGKKTSVALMRAVQLHPVTDRPLHVDFQRMVAGQQIRVEIPVHFVGEDECPGIKRDGVLNTVYHSVEINCDVDHIPEAFTADISGLDLHDTISWSQLQGTENVTHTNQHEEDFVIATIAAPTVAVEVEDEAAEAEEAASEEKASEE
ncbi:Ribosomal protein L25 (general stress protein Ctc) (RplY) (PDB:1B75) [Commensalibacter communis]|uniref:Large ribosomal subunit protein bL25 n=1 Tax=Commensalibacter communis TaxID=2972786 RepID=A0A9W4TQJ9_9PROT|nr:Ribosomal protein L25 (general stress protein Ctc) (RplY) (PDB:1B75) [Commensalibacter communis]CAI3952055.1 Ribosomal protein L25 (general stress protein Ctc) (RplY) (PDB:1B75) [Commensalibacter communis]CAI3954642.1 Ribosomal protein L25 (general stress protein Ctc) (RplY) (PDB:1B75) [Commensalibacter communis]CAI3955067.1 Ribosomal protein L25 (general stress protein Ctc) (RplY) (PDB:1B75) [Commensalibacter communis]CAI3955632.1 Ribosomal protein L25 (general stress protein Ctc) (RplY) (P